MAEMQFEENEFERPDLSQEPPRFANFLINKGIVQNEDQASYVSVGIVVVLIIISLFIFFSGGSGEPKKGRVPVDQFVAE
jgi:hypothetical protein